MVKKILIFIGVVLLLIVVGAVVTVKYFAPDKQAIVEFIKNNPERSSIKLVRNDSVLWELNSDVIRPLASTVKIILAIEYAEQVAAGLFSADQKIALAELDQFYVPNTDGGAHPAWLKSIATKISNDSISIREIAKGMIRFSSNANTEWLLEKLSSEKVNQRITLLGIKEHTAIYPIVSALFVGKESFPVFKGAELEKSLRQMTLTDYVKQTYLIHEKLKVDTSYRKNLGDLSFDIQRIWSDRLPGSTVAEYASLVKKINGRTYFSEQVHQHLNEVIEFLMESPANRNLFVHAGMKGGSTAFVLTKALYATDTKGGNTTELAYFFNDLNLLESRQLQMSMNAFELAVLTDADFRKYISSIRK